MDLDVIRRVTIEGKTTGVKEATQDVTALSTAMTKLADVSERLDEDSGALNDAIAKQSVSVNSNSRNWTDMASGVQDVSQSLADTTGNVLNTVNHIKLLALAAYALSPAFRGVVNAALPVALSAVGTAAASAGSAILSFAGPALAFFGRITAPIAAVVVVWDLLNAVIDRGATLLEKYQDAGRSLDRSDLKSSLESLTKFQADTISADQVQYAAELGDRLAAAKRTIDEFFKVQLDLTTAALALQNAWVAINEAIAKVLTLIPQIVGGTASAAHSIGNLDIWKSLDWGWNLGDKSLLLGQKASSPDTSNDAAMTAARAKLSAGMGVANVGKDGASIGGSFSARWNDDITGLAKVDDLNKKVKESTDAVKDAFDRAMDSSEKRTAAFNADAAAVTLDTGAHTRLRAEADLLSAAKRSDIVLTDAQRLKIDELATAEGNAALAAARAKQQWDQTNQAMQFAGNEMIDVIMKLGDKSQTVTQIMASLAQSIARAALQASLLGSGPLAGLFGTSAAPGTGGTGGLLGALGGLFGIGKSGGVGPGGVGETGPALGEFIVAHTGGVLGADSLSGRYVHPAYFDDAPRYHSGGIAGDEVPIIAKKGEGVFTPGQMAAMGGGSGGPTISLSVTNTFVNADPQSEARLRAYVDASMPRTAALAAQQVAQIRGNNPNYLKAR